MIKWHAALLALVLAFPAAAQTSAPASAAGASTPAGAVRIERIAVRSPALEGNIEGNAATRDVWVVLPPSYASQPNRRYPVLYALHGYTMTPQSWFGADKLESRIGNAFRSGVREMIVVFPSAHTRYDGSMYSTSATSGDWERFVVRDLVGYIDQHYRSMPDRASRGLMGHSMGGYGTVRLGMKYPEVFSSLYAMSACCLSARDMTVDLGKQVEAVKTVAEAQAGSFMIRATFATASAWSPNPRKPPFYADLPYENGQIQPRVIAEWAANAPLAMLPQYVNNVRQYKSIVIDVGDRDGLIGDNTALHELLDRFGIAHRFEIYAGDHGSGVASRFEQNVLPHFSRNLQF